MPQPRRTGIEVGVSAAVRQALDTVEGDVEVLPVTEFVPNLGFARDGELLAVTFADGRVRLWDVERGTPIAVWSGHSETVRAVAFSPDGSRYGGALRITGGAADDQRR